MHISESHAATARARRTRLRIIIWLVGVGGLIGLVAAGRSLPHPDAWRGVTVAWVLVAGAANTWLALRRP